MAISVSMQNHHHLPVLELFSLSFCCSICSLYRKAHYPTCALKWIALASILSEHAAYDDDLSFQAVCPSRGM